ncbi:MAG: alanine--tRNA ligase [Candidatus Omnitrophica bacterium]|nr:alanine--tRNA ligase [Candidatus Omnitrophota bacterium]
MKSHEIRARFLKFFESKGHRVFASDLLVPRNDPSVLFTGAGMNQFKEQFMGNISDFRRAASCQKCLRTGDLENVGKSPTHHTFFEMLGNFSFGDYFKPEAIGWAWEFVVRELGMPAERLWISVHEKDEEAYRIWQERIGIPAQRLVRMSDRDNFWPANAPTDGPNGPCGPCSEIYYDWGPAYGCGRPDCSPACGCKRFSEIWNLVFTQYNRLSDGSLSPLPSKNIDTGMGLERITSVLQNVRENYGTDLFLPILQAIREELGRENIYPPEAWHQNAAKTVADHIRAAVFAVGDGVIPSNEAQGYVIRKIIRRSTVLLQRAGVNKPLGYRLVYPVAAVMEQPYPELLQRQEHIAAIIKKEEELFWKILNERAPQTETAFRDLADSLRSAAAQERDAAAAQLAFIQYDTYGVPLEISKEIAARHKLTVNDAVFEGHMERQRERSRRTTQLSGEIFGHTAGAYFQGLQTEFVGYEHLETDGTVLLILSDNTPLTQAAAGQTVDVVVDRSCFYGEGGGQLGDTGTISGAHGLCADVIRTQKNDTAVLHRLIIRTGVLNVSDRVHLQVVRPERLDTARNHTATHLLQYALRCLVGSQVEQAGSYVGPDKLRFDFSHTAALSADLLRRIEDCVNEAVWENLPVQAQVLSRQEAHTQGALAFFGEKYGDTVRMLSIGGRSRELCGGTHVQATGEIGLFKIISESAVAQGIRRIEAVTGRGALSYLRAQENRVREVAAALKNSPDKAVETIEKLLQQLKILEKDMRQARLESVQAQARKVLADQPATGVVRLIYEYPDADPQLLRAFWDALRAEREQIVCVLAAGAAQKPLLLVGVSPALSARGLDAVKIIKKITEMSGGGGGGGKRELAQAGVSSAAGLRAAMAQAAGVVDTFLREL